MEGPYKLRVMYIGKLNEDMDNNLAASMEGIGYELVTTGYNLISKERQLNFELKGSDGRASGKD